MPRLCLSFHILLELRNCIQITMLPIGEPDPLIEGPLTDQLTPQRSKLRIIENGEDVIIEMLPVLPSEPSNLRSKMNSCRPNC